MSKPIQSLINHVVFVLDRSGSMQPHTSRVVDVFDAQIKYLAQRSQELDQETRVTVYFFNDTVECLVYDKDVLRLPSLRGRYRPGGQTALVDATLKALDDLARTPELYGDHAFLTYVMTDGMNNLGQQRVPEVERRLRGLPDNWTVGVLVPDQTGVFEAKRFGFPANNISVWSTTSALGVEGVGETIRRATDTFMAARTTGVRSTKNLFAVDTANLTAKNVVTNLRKINPLFLYVPSGNTLPIADFVEASTRTEYVKGSAYYELTKPETIQADKKIIVVHRRTGDTYGGPDARQLLGLPDYEVRVSPPQAHDQYEVFIQSNSVNRKLVPGTRLLIL